MENSIWSNSNFFILQHSSKLPWVKLFSKKKYKEISELPKDLKIQMYDLLGVIEQTMIEYYKPDKINIASFGNILPHLHWHIIARFRDDPYFPKTTWEEPVREYNLQLPDFKEFEGVLRKKLIPFS